MKFRVLEVLAPVDHPNENFHYKVQRRVALFFWETLETYLELKYAEDRVGLELRRIAARKIQAKFRRVILVADSSKEDSQVRSPEDPPSLLKRLQACALRSDRQVIVTREEVLSIYQHCTDLTEENAKLRFLLEGNHY